MQPTAEEKQVRIEKTIVPSLRSTLANKAATLWESRAPILKFKPLDDIDPMMENQGIFSTNIVAKDLELDQWNFMERVLVDHFMEWVKSSHHEQDIDGDLSNAWKIFRKKGGRLFLF
jgi:hypothetical protein